MLVGWVTLVDVGRLGGWVVGWLVGWLVGWFVGWLVGRSGGWRFFLLACCCNYMLFLVVLACFLDCPCNTLVYVGTFCIFLSFEQSLFCVFHKGVEALMWLVTFGWGCWSDSLYI